MKNRRNFSCAAGVIVALLSSTALAQTVDYGAHEFMFEESVTTSATGVPQRLSDAPVNMTIITQAQIADSGLANIPEILDRFSGVNVQRRSRTMFDVSIRGYNQGMSNRVLVLVNGRQVYLDSYGYTDWSSIPVQLEEIRQIEIVRGPNAALFGFNAVSGVINIITFNPLYDDVSAATARAGNNGFGGGSGVVTLKPSDRFGLRLSGGGFRTEEYEVEANPSPADADDPSRIAFNGEALFQAASNVQVGLEVGYSSVDTQLTAANGGGFLVDYTNFSVRGSMHAETRYGLMTLRAYHNSTENDVTQLPSFDFQFDNETTVVQAENMFKVGANNTFRLGIEYRNNNMTAVTITPGVEGKVGYNVLAGSVMWNRTISDDLSAVAAIRYDLLDMYYDGSVDPTTPLTLDQFDRAFGNVSFNLGAVWKPSAEDTLRAGVARAATLPSQMELGGLQFPIAYSNPDIDPTQTTNFELGYDRALSSIGATAHGGVFYQLNEDVRDTVGTLPALFENVGTSNLFGIELAIDGTASSTGVFDQVRWGASYTGLFISDDVSSDASIAHEDWTPKHEIEANLGVSAGKLHLDANARYRSDFETFSPAPNAPVAAILDVDAHVDLDLRIAYDVVDDVVLELVGQRLLDENDGSTGSSDDERSVFIAMKAKF